MTALEVECHHEHGEKMGKSPRARPNYFVVQGNAVVQAAGFDEWPALFLSARVDLRRQVWRDEIEDYSHRW